MMGWRIDLTQVAWLFFVVAGCEGERTPPIECTPPTVSVAPATPTTADDLVASVDDAGARLAWTRDGVDVAEVNGSIVPAALTTRGETWSVTATRTDVDGEECQASASVLVVNAPPRIAAVTTDPTSGRETTAFRCIAEVDDADGDALTLDIAWQVGLATIPGDVLTPGQFTAVDEVRCRVTATDGITTDGPVISTPVSSIEDNAGTGEVGTAGGDVTFPDGTAVHVPAGALPSDVVITGGTVPMPTDLPPGHEGVAAVEMFPHGLTFIEPLVIVVPLSALAEPGTTLAVFTRDDTGTQVPATLSSGESVVAVVGSDGTWAAFSVDHFSTYTATTFTPGSALIPAYEVRRHLGTNGSQVATWIPPGTVFDPLLAVALAEPLVRRGFWREILRDLIVEADYEAFDALPCFAAPVIGKILGGIDPVAGTLRAYVDHTPAGARFARDFVLGWDRHATFRNVRANLGPKFDALETITTAAEIVGVVRATRRQIAETVVMQSVYREIILQRIEAFDDLVAADVANGGEVTSDPEFLAAWNATRADVLAESDPQTDELWHNLLTPDSPVVDFFIDRGVSYLIDFIRNQAFAQLGGGAGVLVVGLRWALEDTATVNAQEARQALRATLEYGLLRQADPSALSSQDQDPLDVAQSRQAILVLLRLYNARAWAEADRRYFDEIPFNLVTRSLIRVWTFVDARLSADGLSHPARAAARRQAQRDAHDGAYRNLQVYLGVPGYLGPALGCQWQGTDADADGHDYPADCNDLHPAIFPGAVDPIGGAYDQNCDGIDGVDADGDDIPSIASGGDDCDDGNASIHPGAPDQCGDLIDQDCDGNDAVCAESCNQLDDDGDGLTDEGFVYVQVPGSLHEVNEGAYTGVWWLGRGPTSLGLAWAVGEGNVTDVLRFRALGLDGGPLTAAVSTTTHQPSNHHAPVWLGDRFVTGHTKRSYACGGSTSLTCQTQLQAFSADGSRVVAPILAATDTPNVTTGPVMGGEYVLVFRPATGPGDVRLRSYTTTGAAGAIAGTLTSLAGGETFNAIAGTSTALEVFWVLAREDGSLRLLVTDHAGSVIRGPVTLTTSGALPDSRGGAHALVAGGLLHVLFVDPSTTTTFVGRWGLDGQAVGTPTPIATGGGAGAMALEGEQLYVTTGGGTAPDQLQLARVALNGSLLQVATPVALPGSEATAAIAAVPTGAIVVRGDAATGIAWARYGCP